MLASSLIDLLNTGTRFGVDGCAISTFRSSAYVNRHLPIGLKNLFYKFVVIPTGHKQEYAPTTKIVLSNPTSNGIDLLNQHLIGKKFISELEPYVLWQFNTKDEADNFVKENKLAYLSRARSHNNNVVDSGSNLKQRIPEHCYPGETNYVNSRSGKHNDSVYVSFDKADKSKWVVKLEAKLCSATEVKRLTGISTLKELSALLADPQKMKALVLSLFKTSSLAVVNKDKLTRWLGANKKDTLTVTTFLRMVKSIADFNPKDNEYFPSHIPYDSFALFSYGIKRWQKQIKAKRGRKTQWEARLLKLQPFRFKLEIELPVAEADVAPAVATDDGLAPALPAQDPAEAEGQDILRCPSPVCAPADPAACLPAKRDAPGTGIPPPV